MNYQKKNFINNQLLNVLSKLPYDLIDDLDLTLLFISSNIKTDTILRTRNLILI